MLIAICTVCGASRDDLAAGDVWAWLEDHAAVEHPPAHGTRERYESCRCDVCMKGEAHRVRSKPGQNRPEWLQRAQA